MPTIAKDNDVITLINVFTVRPEHQQRLVDVLVEATEAVMKHQPGFVSASIHKSLDGTRVTNYAQWSSQAAFEAMLKDSEANVHMQEAAHISKTAVAGQGMRMFFRPKRGYKAAAMQFIDLPVVSAAFFATVSAFFVTVGVSVVRNGNSFLIVPIAVLVLAVVVGLVFLGYYVLALWSATSHNPPLPTVEITLAKTEQPITSGDVPPARQAGGHTLRGPLLDHSGGVWYFFNEEDNNTLTAIPDSEIQQARIIG